MIVYIHGFNSLPSKEDLAWINESFPCEKVYAPVINYVDKKNVDNAIAEIKRVVANSDEVFFIAKSLGCIMTEIVAGHFDNVLFINPAYGFVSTLDKYSKMKSLENFRNKDLVSHVDPDFLDHLNSKNRRKPFGTAMLAKNDEILDMSLVESKCESHYTIKKFEGSHSVALSDIPNLKEVIDSTINYIGYIDF